MQASPFLVSRNRYLDYRTVVAPQFICQAGISNLLARAADSELIESEDVFYRQIQGSKIGDFSIVFRVVKARRKNGNFLEEIAKDQFGREIYWMEGFVLQDIDKPAVGKADFEKLHQFLSSKYEQFWDLTEPEPALPSSTISLAADNSVPVQQLPVFKVPSKSRSVAPIQEPEKKSDRPWIFAGIILVTLILVSVLVGQMMLGQPVSQDPQRGAGSKTENVKTQTKPPSGAKPKTENERKHFGL